jgi:hypothetical protein
MVIWYIFPVLVSCIKKNMATLQSIFYGHLVYMYFFLFGKLYQENLAAQQSIFYVHLVYFPRFGKLYQETSGNPAAHQNVERVGADAVGDGHRAFPLSRDDEAGEDFRNGGADGQEGEPHHRVRNFEGVADDGDHPEVDFEESATTEIYGQNIHF